MSPFRSEKDRKFEDWPVVGEVLVDRRGERRLTVSDVQPRSRAGRNVVGTLQDGAPYSCDVPTLLVMWARGNGDVDLASRRR